MRTTTIRTPWAVICPRDGTVYLTEKEYMSQLKLPDKMWECPICGKMPVRFDDENFEGR